MTKRMTVLVLLQVRPSGSIGSMHFRQRWPGKRRILAVLSALAGAGRQLGDNQLQCSRNTL
jgi:hypothetical protein